MTKSGEREIIIRENSRGGEAVCRIEHLLNEEERGTGCGAFAQVTIDVGGVLEFHKHHGETETYFILQGTGMYRDNDKLYVVNPGDVVFCENGSGHGLANTGNVDIKFMALILKK